MLAIKSILFAIYLWIALDSLTYPIECGNIEREKKLRNSLHVIGIPWSPFAYFDKPNNNRLRGIDISLVTAMAKQLDLSMDIQWIGSNISQNNKPTSLVNFLANR